MKQPFMNMCRPHQSDYLERTKNIVIYKYYEKYRDDYSCEEDEFEAHGNQFYNEGEPDGTQHWYSSYIDQHKTPKINLDKISFQFLIDLLPDGVSPSDVKITTSVDAGDGGIYGHEVSFYYTKMFPAEPEKYTEHFAIWQKLHDEYEIKNNVYKKYVAQQEIDELNKKIALLK